MHTRFVGRRDRAPDWLREKMEGLERATDAASAARTSGSRSTTAAAPRSWRPRAAWPTSGGATIDEESFAQHLYAPEMPDPDLVIRTSGELPLSNFLLWQSAYAEYVFTDTLWPDFGPEEFRSALEDYAQRRRRFGGR